jgi:hypothetical protein
MSGFVDSMSRFHIQLGSLYKFVCMITTLHQELCRVVVMLCMTQN